MHAHMHTKHVYCLHQLNDDDHQSTITAVSFGCLLLKSMPILLCVPAYLLIQLSYSKRLYENAITQRQRKRQSVRDTGQSKREKDKIRNVYM